MKALFIVDVQNDFLPGGALPAPEGDRILPVVNTLSERFPLVAASRDWHPEESVHFEKWPPHCIRESPGADFPEKMNTDRIDQFFLKGTGNADDGYSAFEATNRDLVSYLRNHAVDHLFICGLTTEYCVRSTALDALEIGFRTTVILDAVAGVDAHPGDEEKALADMEARGVILTKSPDLLL